MSWLCLTAWDSLIVVAFRHTRLHDLAINVLDIPLHSASTSLACMDLRKQVFKVPQSIPAPATASTTGLPAGPSGHGQHSQEPPSPDLWKQYWDHASDVQLPDRWAGPVCSW